MKRPALYLVIALALVLAPVSVGLAGSDMAPGSLTADQILERCDEFHHGYSDSQITVRTVIKDKDGNKTLLLSEMFEKGQKRLMIFSEPPDIAGMAVLAKDPDTIYVYEPEFNKVRRIAAHAKKQTMFGMDYTMDESGIRHLAVHYKPSIESEDEKQAVLVLKQKPGKDKAWPKLKLTIQKDSHWEAVKIQYFDDKGKKRKTETRKGLKKLGGRLVTSVMIMKSHVKKHSTTLIMKKAKYNQGLTDKMFSKRYLIREE
jgi:outer membrane lipoprotein-sorting protein